MWNIVRLLKRLSTTIVLSICVVHIYYSLQEVDVNDEDINSEHHSINSLHNKHKKSSLCVLPHLEFMPEAFQKYYKDTPKFGCLPESNWVEVNNGQVEITEYAKLKYSQLECAITPIVRKNDYIAKYNKDAIVKLGIDKIPATTDFMKVECTSSDGNYNNLHLTVVPKPELGTGRVSYPNNSLGVDVIIVGFDSVSRMSWLRNLPLVHKYFEEEMGGVVMKGYNIVGDGTPQALMPILTGHSELELPEVRRGFKSAKQLDRLPWIWKDLKKAGYVTQWGEDGAATGTFQMRMLGFKDPPVDHYMRPFQIVVEEEEGEHPPLCLKSKTRFQYMLDYITHLYEAYKHRPKLSFMFYSAYSHNDLNMLQVAQMELLNFLKMIKNTEAYANTLLILMSDHGQRTVEDLRSLLQGKYEERMPYVGISLPGRIQQKYPEMVKNLMRNSDKLTTPFDFHETLKNVLNFDIEKIRTPHTITRGLSLFREIPEGRSCVEAQIAAHWCTCLKWLEVSKDGDNAKAAAWALISQINQLTQDFRDQCEELMLSKIIKVEKYTPSEKLLRFVGNIDRDGRIPEFNEKMEKGVNDMYQVTVQTMPNNGMYEATAVLQAQINYVVDSSYISRINRYGDDPHCIINSHPHLRPYCYCKDKKNQ